MVTPEPRVTPAGEMLRPAITLGRAGVIETPLPILPDRMAWVSIIVTFSFFFSASTVFLADVASSCNVFRSSIVTTFGFFPDEVLVDLVILMEAPPRGSSGSTS